MVNQDQNQDKVIGLKTYAAQRNNKKVAVAAGAAMLLGAVVKSAVEKEVTLGSLVAIMSATFFLSDNL